MKTQTMTELQPGGGGKTLERRPFRHFAQLFKKPTTFLESFSIRNASAILNRTYGFTLAEVLITLGIIGVVAAMTLPTLVQNYKKKVYANQIKKAFSIFSQGMQRMYINENCPNWECMGLSTDDINNTDLMLDKFKKAFTIVTSDNNNGQIEYVHALGSPETAGFGGNLGNEYLFKFTLPDGSIWYYHGVGFYADTFLITVDTNGLKAPNEEGRDVFTIFLTQKGVPAPIFGRQFWEGVCSSKTSNHICTVDEMTEFYIPAMVESCDLSSNDKTLASMSCLTRLIEDNWEMKY